jgi:hypothetical protein
MSPGPQRDSELLFPSTTGGYQSSTTLDNPIKAIAKAAKVGKHLSARCIRWTFQDLGRAVEAHDFVARAISGHATVEMQSHYSSVSGEEVRQGLAKVIFTGRYQGAGPSGGRRRKRQWRRGVRWSCRY